MFRYPVRQRQSWGEAVGLLLWLSMLEVVVMLDGHCLLSLLKSQRSRLWVTNG